MRKSNIKTPIVFYAAIFLFAAVLFTSRLTGGLYARYLTQSDSSDSARVARFAYTIELDDSVTAMTAMSTDTEGAMVICVQVNNQTKDNNHVSEVAQTYSLAAENLTGNIPLTFAFYSDEACTQLVADPSGEFSPATEQSATYYLKISLNTSAPIDAERAEEVDLIRITASSTQID